MCWDHSGPSGKLLGIHWESQESTRSPRSPLGVHWELWLSGNYCEVAQTLGRSFFDPKIRAGLIFKVGSVLTLLLRAVVYLLLHMATGIALLPVAAALSPRETDSKMNLPKGILRPERVVKQLLEEEEAISKIY